jgi:hypothetical protein
MGCNVPRDQPPWVEQAELLDLVEATHGVLDEVGSAGLAGFVVTPEKCRLDLYWVGAPPPAVAELVREDRRVVVHDDADHDHAELSRAADRLAPGSPLGRSAGVEITSVAIPPEGAGLRVGVDAEGRPIDVRAAATELSAGVGVPVRVVIEGPSRPFGRIDDRAPWSAGGRAMIRVNDGGSERWSACSLGYGLRDPRTMREYTVTAAHCFDEAADPTAWNGIRRGTDRRLERAVPGARRRLRGDRRIFRGPGHVGTGVVRWGGRRSPGCAHRHGQLADRQGHVGLRLRRRHQRELRHQGQRR